MGQSQPSISADLVIIQRTCENSDSRFIRRAVRPDSDDLTFDRLGSGTSRFAN